MEYKLKYSKWLDSQGETINYELKANDTLHDLLTLAVVKNVDTLKNQVFGNKLERYKVKSLILNSSYFKDCFLPLFSKEFIDNKKVQLKFSNLQDCKLYENELLKIGQFLQEIVNTLSLSETKETEITLKEIKQDDK